MKHLYRSLNILLTIAFCTVAAPLWSATYTVINTGDSGAGSLRQAITDANANPGADIIVFNIPGAGPWSITVSSALPNITGPIVIDGTTQPGFTSGTQSTYVKVGTAFTSTIFSASNVTGITIKGLDLSYSSPRGGSGIGFANCKETFILDNYIRNRRTGVAINGGQDHTLQNNDFLASGDNNNEPCIHLLNITAGSIPSGVAMSGNKFGGNANMGFRIDNMTNLVIGDASVSGANIVIEDNSGFTAIGQGGQYMLWFNNCNNITIDNVDLSWSGGGQANSHAIIVSNTVSNSGITVKNCNLKSRYTGVSVTNGKDVIIRDNDLRGCGESDSYAVYLSNITAANVSSGVLMSGNLWGRNGSVECRGGLRINAMNNLVIGDAATGVHIKIEDNSGFNTVEGNNINRGPLYLENVSNITVDDIDAAWTPTNAQVTGFGIRVGNTGSNGNITIKNCQFKNRFVGIYCSDGKDYTITGNDLRGCGENNQFAMYLLSIAEGMIPGGVLVHSNLWGQNPTGPVNSRGGLYISDMNGLVIGDATTGVHIKIEDNSGFNTIEGNDANNRGCLWLERVSNITVDNIDASWTSASVPNSFGIYVQNETSNGSGITTANRNITIKNCDFRNRGQGIRIRGGKDYTLTGNDMRGCGEHGHYSLSLINIQAGLLTGGVFAHSNLYGANGATNSNNGIYIERLSDLVIGDATTGVNMKIEDASGLNTVAGNDVSNRGALYLNTVNNITVDNVDCSKSTTGQGNSWAIRVANTTANMGVTIKNCLAGNRARGIWIDGGRDYTLTGNNIVGSGNGSPALELSNIVPGALAGGIQASGNTFGTPNFKRGVVIQNMRNLLIGDENVAGANIVLEDACGLNLCQGDGYSSIHGPLYLGSVDNVTVDGVDCSKSTAGQGGSYAIYVINSVVNQNVTIKNCKADNRQRGIYCTGGKDYTIQNNSITNSGSDGEACALDLRDVTAGSLTGGVLISGNTFGNVPITANLSRAAVRFDNMRDLTIGDASTGGNVKLEDGNGLTEVGIEQNSAYIVLNFNNVSNSSVDNLNLSYSGASQVGNAIRVSNGAGLGTMTIRDCTIGNRRMGIYINGGRDYTITGNNLTGTGQNDALDLNSGGAAVWLSGVVKGSLDGGIAMSGNIFGGANANCALRIDDMRGFSIGDAASDDIRFEDGVSGLANVGNATNSSNFAIYLRQISDVTVNSVDLTRSGGTPFGGGIRVDNGNGNKTVAFTNNNIGNRRTGIYISGGSDYTITGNSLGSSGVNDGEPALYLNGILSDALPGGLAVSGNTFGGTNANTAIRFENLKNIVVGDASVAGRNVTLEDGTSGLSAVGNNAASGESVLFFSNVSNSSINNVDLTRSGGTQFSRGIYVANGTAAYPFSITNCVVGNRRTGIYLSTGRDYTIQNNNLSGSGASVDEPALFLGFLTVNSNLAVSGNTFGGANFNAGIRVESTNDLLISDGTVSGTHVAVTTANGLGNAANTAIYLANTNRVKVQNMNLSFTTTTKTGTGVHVTTNGGTTSNVEMKSLTVKNRVNGILLSSGSGHSVACNDLSENTDGLEIAGSMTNLICEQNTFVANTAYAINSASTIKAENNYFGGAAPPVGTPNGVTAPVDAAPHLTSAPVNCPSTSAPFLELRGNLLLVQNGSLTPSTSNFTDFGSLKTGTGVTRSFTLRNLGGTPLNVSSISVSGGNAADFSVGSLSPASPVPAGGSATFTITFTPGAAGLRSTTLVIASDDPNNNPFNAALQGTGKNALVVTKTADTNDGVCDADCSLREAITVANSNADADVIEFSIGSGAQTITHTTAFPTITQPLTIDGTTQPGYAGTPLITVNSNSSLITFLVTNVTGFTIKGMDLSRPDANFDGGGVVLSNCNTVTIQNNVIRNRLSGIVTNGGYDYTIQNNDLKNTGWRESEPAVWLRNLTSRTIPGGVTMSGNIWGDLAGANNYQAGTALRIDNMSGLVIGDASVSGRHITIEDVTSGWNNVQAVATNSGIATLLYLSTVTDITVDNVDMSQSNTTQNGTAVLVASGSRNVTIRNCAIQYRYRGISCEGGQDYTLQNNDIRNTGYGGDFAAIRLSGVTTGSIPAGVTASGNQMGGTANYLGTALRIVNMSGLVIGDAGVSGAHIVIADNELADFKGANNGGHDEILSFNNVSNLTIDNVDLTHSIVGNNGYAISIVNTANNRNVTIKNCAVQYRVRGIFLSGGKDYTVLNNNLAHTGSDINNPALYLSSIRPGALEAGIVASGNTFGYTSGSVSAKTALRVSGMDGLLIGDASVSGAHVVIEDGSGAKNLNNTGDNEAAIYMSAVSNITIDNVDVSYTPSGRAGAGIWVENNSSLYRNISIKNCKIQQRQVGIYVNGGKDATIQNNDLRYSGFYTARPAIYLNNIQRGTMPGGISMSGNLFGGTNNGATANMGITINSMSDLVISDGSLPGTNILLEDLSGLNEIAGSDANSYGCLHLNAVRNVQINSVDMSKASGGQASSFALWVNNGYNVSVTNSSGANRIRGYYFSGGQDVTVSGNILTASGQSRDNPALYFSSIQPGSIHTVSGIAGSGNTYGGSSVRTALRIDNMKNILIGDASVSGAHFVVEDASGMNNCTQADNNSEHPVIYLVSVSDITVDNVDASFPGGGKDKGGIWVSNGTGSNLGNVAIKNCNFNNHRRSVYISGGRDYTLQNNSVLNSGIATLEPAMYLQNIQARNLPGGILMSGNTFGGSSAFGGIRFENMRDLYIGDASTGVNVKIEDNSGLNNLGGNGSNSAYFVLHLVNVLNTTVDNVDVSRPVGATPAQDFTGIRVDNGAAYGPVSIKNCDVRRHRTGIIIQGGQDYTVTGNDLRGSGISSDEPAIHFNNVVGSSTVPMGILANTNLFGTTNSVVSNCGLRIDNMCGIKISDGSVSGSHIKLESGSGIREVTGSGGTYPSVIALLNNSGMSVEKIDLEFAGTQTGTGIRFQNSNASQYDNDIKDNILKNRRMGLTIINGADYTITGNNFQMSGAADDEPAIRLEHVAEGTLYGGVSMSGNTFGGTGAAFGLKFVNMSNLKISDGTLSGTNVNLGLPAANGLYNVTIGNVLHLSGVCNATVGQLDLSRAGLTRQGTGLRMNAGLGNTIEKVLVGNRDKGIEITGGSNSQSFSCNTLFDNNFGIDVVLGTLLGTTLTNNILDCNGTGLRSTSTSTVNAANNFWGASNGSSGSGGSGDSYSGTVTATPFLAAAPACAQASPDLETKGNSIEIVDGDLTPAMTDHTQFCAVTNQTQSYTYTLRNAGKGILNLTGANPVSLTPPSGTPFSITAQPADVELLPGETTTFTIQFAPVALGAFNATVNIASKDCRENPYNYAIKGQGCIDIQATLSGTQAICAGQPANLIVNINAGVAPFVVTLSDGSVFTVNNIGNNTVTVNPASTTTYTITSIMDANGCCSTNNGSAVVTVNPLPTVSVGIDDASGNTNDDGILCAGASATLDAGVFAAYEWSTMAGTQTINVTTGGAYTVTVTDANGCENSATATITVNANPTPAITETDNSGTADDNIICSGGTATLDAGAWTAWLWTGGATTQTLSVSSGGTYFVTVTDANGCTGSDDHSIQENALPAATLSGTETVCPGVTTSTVSLNITAGVAPFTVVLSDASSHNVAALGAATLNVTVAGPGTNTFTITSITGAGGCAGTGSGTATVAFGSIGEIEISGNGNPITDGDNTPASADHTDFGPVATGNNLTRTFTITNNHPTLSLNISGVTITGSTDFTLMTPPAGTVAANGGTTTFVVKFAPTALGLASATVVVNSSDCDEQPYNFDVQGTGATPAAALHFDGENDDVIIPHASNINFALNQDFTVSLHVKIPSTNQPNSAAIDNSILEKTITGAGYPYVIRYYNHTSGAGTNGKVYAARWNGSTAVVVTSTVTLNDDTWHHIAFVKSGPTLYLYIDGVLNSTTADLTSGSTSNTGPLSIGSRTSISNWFQGGIDNLRIWNDARTCEEINQLRNCEMTGSEPNLVAYYNFNQGFANENNSGVTTLIDAAGGDNNGTLNSFTLTGTTSNWIAPGGVVTGTSCPVSITFPEANVQGNSTTIADGDNTPATADHTDFGLVTVNGSLVRTFTVQNTGTSALTVSSITSNNGLFTLGSLTPASPVPAGGSATFTVTFSPTAAGTQTATITVNSNDCDEAAYDFSVTGTGALPGAALAFDGADDYVDVAYSLNQSSLTLEAWVKPTSNARMYTICNDNPGNHGAGFGVNNYQLEIDCHNTFINVPGTLFSNGVWAHVAVVYQPNGRVRAYVNGTEVYNAIPNTSWLSTMNGTANFTLGRHNAGFPLAWSGSIDEVRVWTRSLCQAEIQAQQNCELTGSEPDLAIYYKFNQGIANNANPGLTTLNDLAGTAQNGTLTNFTLSGSNSNWTEPGGVTSGTSCTPYLQQEINVQGNSTTIADGDNTPATADHTNFGLVAVNGSLVRTFTVQNTGTSALTVSSITSNNALFALGALTPASPIPAGSSATFTVTFSPTALGVQNATITVNNDDCDEAVYDFAVTGTGATPAAALNFDGSNDYVEVPNSASLNNYASTGEITIEYWIKPAFTVSGQQNIIARRNAGNTAGFIFEHNGALVNHWFNTSAGWQKIDFAYTNNVWQHIAVTAKIGGSMIVYKDGVPVATAGLSGTSFTSLTNSVLRLMANTMGPATSFTPGSLDEVRIWSVARTCDQINQLRNCELTGSEPSLVAYYKFNQGFANENNSGVTTLTDATSNGNNGTLTNFALAGASSNWVAPGGVTTGTSCPAVTAPEANVQGGSPLVTIADGSNTPSTTNHSDFGPVVVNGSLVRTFTIQNTGTSALTVSSITSSNGLFALGALTPASPIPAGNSASFTVTFSPTALGVQNATITINNNDCDEAVYDFAVTGKGATPAAALDCSGSNDYVSLSGTNTLLDGATQFTIEHWIKSNGTGGVGIVGKGASGCCANTIHTGLDVGGVFFLKIGNQDGLITGAGVVPTGTWVHLAAVYNGNASTPSERIKIYANGVLQTATMFGSIPATAPSPNVPFVIGAALSDGAFNYNGQIDEVRIWNTALNCDQINQLRNCELSGSESGLVAYYKFNQGFANENNGGVTTLTDAAGGDNNGTLNNFILTGTASNWVTPGGVTTGTSCPAVTAPEANVQGGSPLVTIADGSNTPSTTNHSDFGPVAVNGSIVRTFTIQNTGTGALTVSSITSSNGLFALGALTPASPIPAGNSASFTVTFSPTALGVQNATITINTNDCDEAVYDFAVTGKGATPAAALDFDGTNDYVSLPGTFGGPGWTELTIEAWVKVAATSGDFQAIVSATDLAFAHFQLFNAGQNVAFTNTGGVTLPIIPQTPTGQWRHVAMVVKSGDSRLYVDGVQQGPAVTTTFGNILASSSVSIGRGASGGRFLNGQLDEVRIWNTARSCDQINQLRNCELSGSESGLVAYYKFNQGFANENNSTVTTLDDATANNNDGTLSNTFALTGTASNWVTPGSVTTGTSCPAVTAPEANVQGGSPLVTIADGSNTPSTTNHSDFGPVAVNGSLVRTFTIQNTGTSALTVSSITSSNGLFALGTLTPASPIPAGNSASFTVTFSPTALGVQNATITINNDDCDEAVYDFSVTGKGATPAAALHFDGIDDYISTSNNTILDLSTQTVEFWAKPGGSGDNDLLVGKRNYGGTNNSDIRWSIHFQNGNQGLYFYSPVGLAVWTYAFTPNQWYHIAMVTDATSTKLYIDGTFISSKPTTINAPTNLPVIFGASGPNYEVFPGSLDEVRIWNTARSCDQINQLRNCELSGSESGLVAYYKFNQGFANENNSTVTTLDDATANNNDGTLSNTFALNGASSNWVTPGGVVTGTSCPAVTSPEADLLGHDNTPLADGTTGTSVAQGTNLGSVNLGSSSAAKTFTIQNNGTTALTVSSIVSSDPQFALTALSPASPVPAGMSATFTITFTPTATGVQNATITINNDDCDEAVYTFAVTGTGVCIPPSFTACPTGPLTATTLTGTCAAPVSYTVTEAGTPAPALTYTFTGATTGSGNGTGSGSSFDKGSTIVTVTATNTCSPAATCSFTVTVTDNQNPTITCSANVTQNTNAGTCVATVAVPSPSATDNCSTTNTTNGLNFDGTNDYVTVPSAPFTSYTFETWVKFTGTSTLSQSVIYFTDGNVANFSQEILTDNAGHFQHYLWDGSARLVTGTTVAALNTWYHVAIVATNSGLMRLYVNGVEEGTPASLGTMQVAADQLVFGKASIGLSYFKGTLDEVRIWNQVRSQSQIQSAMNVELVGNEPGLYRYFRFNEGVADGNNTALTSILATTGVNGTPVNITLNGTTSNFVSGKLTTAVAPAMTNSFNGTGNASGNYPVGSTTVTWTATDASGNVATCQQTVTVVDNQAPTLVNPGNQAFNVLANSCAADYTIADPVSDNCTSATWGYTLSGATTASASGIADGTGSGVLSFNKGVTTVVLSATDGTNSATTVSFTVTVTDNIAPQITCAGPVTVNTTAGLCTGTATLTPPTVTDNCPFGGNGLNFDGSNDQVVTAAYSGTALTGDLTVECWFNATSLNGRTLVGRGFQQEFDLTLWNNKLDYYHGNGSSWVDLIFSYTFSSNTWYHVAVVRNASAQTVSLYVDGVFQQTLSYGTPLPVAQTAAFRIGNRAAGQFFSGSIDEVRVWTVARTPAQIAANWNKELPAQPDLFALYHLNEGGANADNPGVTTAADVSGNANNGTLSNFALSGTTSNWVVGAFGGVTNNAPATYPKGNTTVTWTATDASGNVATCQQTVTVVDNEAPVVSCPVNQTKPPTVFTPCSAVVNSIDATYSDNCTPTLSYVLGGATSGSGSGHASGQTFLVGTTTVTYTVTDGTLNSSCVFTVTVTNCNIEFSGQIEWSDDQETGVNNVTVNLTGAGTGNDLSDVNGDYLASVPYTTGTFIITPVKNTNKLNGITSADATAIQQHITGAAPITNPYRMIAADVNKTNSITTADATIINQALLGSPSALAQFKTSWRFVPQTHTMSMPPWGFPENITLTGVSSSQTGKDFFGIKTGDLVSIWTNPSTLGAGEPLVLRVQDQVLEAGKEIEVEFRADQLNDLAAWQFALRFDPEQLQLAVVQPLQALPLTLEDFGLLNISEGEIRTAWSQAAGLTLEEATPVFRLKFNVLQSGGKLSDALQLANGILPGRVYNSALAESGVTLEYSGLSQAGPVVATNDYLLLQNVPNPFVRRTRIGFVLPEACEATLRVFDTGGRLLTERSGWYPAGRNTVDFDFGSEAPGVLYYELTTQFGVLAKKMAMAGR